ncbi:MAG: pilus assembly protein N-terminal domain-containing protein [Acidobacteriota bacterium]|nr:pilus assembly protein N-terminal domain-containing protein [Acidobacteriota bacterium]
MSKHRQLQSLLLATRVGLCAILLLQAGNVLAKQQSTAVAQEAPTEVKTGPGQAQESESAQTLHLLVGRSLVITSPNRIKRVSLADPAVAEALVVSPTQVLVNGKTPGGVSLLIWDEADQSQAFEVSVDIDVLGLSQKIHEVFPAEAVHIETSKDVVMLSGHISSATVADKILEVVKNATPKVTSLMEVPPVPHAEILLQVKFADVNRQRLSQLGFNLLSLPGSKNVGTLSTQQFSPPQLSSGTSGPTSNIGLSDLLNIFIFRPDIDFAATIKALQGDNILQILAEPNLITMSGKEASFLAGGEFPFPVLQGTGTGGAAAITIQFKEFGIRLNFTPTLTSDGIIHLKVKPEVSSLDFSNGLIIQGFSIPALATNRVESEMDLKDGQSFAIAGLLDNRVTEQLEKIPGIGDIPILGKLFQSRSVTKSKNELLIVVTPRIVQPLDAVPAGPVMPKKFLDPLPLAQSQTPSPR